MAIQDYAGTAIKMRALRSSVVRPLLRPTYPIKANPNRAMYATEAQDKQTVQTPVQSQNKNNVAPQTLRPEAETPRVQTPMQTQKPSTMMSRPTQQTRAQSGNAGPVYTFWTLLFATPIVCYVYYQYRKEHMDKKREMLVAKVQEKYKSTD